MSDELLTLSDAAQLLIGSPADQAGLPVIRRLIGKWEKGKGGLQAFIDPGEPNSQRNRRVRRSDVLQLKGQRETNSSHAPEGE